MKSKRQVALAVGKAINNKILSKRQRAIAVGKAIREGKK